MDDDTKERFIQSLETHPMLLIGDNAYVLLNLAGGETTFFKGPGEVRVPTIRLTLPEPIGTISIAGHAIILGKVLMGMANYIKDYVAGGGIVIDVQPEEETEVQDDKGIPEDIHAGPDIHQEHPGD